MKVIPLPGRAAVRPTLWAIVRRRHRWFWGALLTVFLTVLFASPLIPDRVSLRPGEKADKDVRARTGVSYVSNLETGLQREAAASRVPPQYEDQPEAAAAALRTLSDTWLSLAAPRSSGSGQPGARKPAHPVTLTPEALAAAAAMSPSDLSDLRLRAETTLSRAMQDDIRADQESLGAARGRVAAMVAALKLPPIRSRLLAETVSGAVRPNRVLSENLTLAARDEAWRSVAPVTRSLARGDVIVRRGETISAAHVEAFQALGLQHGGLDLKRILGLLLFTALIVLGVAVFLRLYQQDVYSDSRRMMVLILLVALSSVGLKIGHSWLGVQMSPTQTGFLTALWIAVPSMLVATFVSGRTALLLSAVLAVAVGVAMDMEPRSIALAVVSALAGICGVARIRDRADLLRIAGVVAGTNVAMVCIFALLMGDSRTEMVTGVFWGLGTGLASALLFWLGVAALERVFGLVTHVGLLELCDLNRELLRRLQWEAPGTFHHSLGVAVLAEAGAEAIGADALLCRVCAYYHDIGKMRRPHYFTENQQVENVHERLAPSLSTIAITSHVKEGLELAKQYRLPPVVTDAIVQHHGTSLVSYFYHQATEGVERSEALEQHFRYEGPRPRTREMAILMLADGAEAISRTIDKPTLQKIDQAIDAIIDGRLRDGQMDDSDLTFREIGLIRAAFVRVLLSMLHSRIEYPGNAQDGAAPRTNGDNVPKNGAASDTPGTASVAR